MKVKDFWTVLLRVIGILLVFGSIGVISHLFNSILYMVMFPEYDAILYAITVIVIFALVLIYVLILRLFIFKPSWLIKNLKLAEGFEDDKIGIDLNQTVVLRVSVIVLGGWLFLNSLPVFVSEVLIFLQQKNVFIQSPQAGAIVFQLAVLVVGYVMMANNKQIVAFIEKKSKNVSENEPSSE
jgi:hypothetical protein